MKIELGKAFVTNMGASSSGLGIVTVSLSGSGRGIESFGGDFDVSLGDAEKLFRAASSNKLRVHFVATDGDE